MKTILLTLIMGLSYLGYAQYPVEGIHCTEMKRDSGQTGFSSHEVFPILEAKDSMLIIHTRDVDTLFIGYYYIPNYGKQTEEFEGITKCFKRYKGVHKCTLKISTLGERQKYRVKYINEKGWVVHYYVFTLFEKDSGWSSDR